MSDIDSDMMGCFECNLPYCCGCKQPLLLENAWMTDGCPCNSPLGVNNQNETRWRLLMQLHQEQSHKLYGATELLSTAIDASESAPPPPVDSPWRYIHLTQAWFDKAREITSGGPVDA